MKADETQLGHMSWKWRTHVEVYADSSAWRVHPYVQRIGNELRKALRWEKGAERKRRDEEESGRDFEHGMKIWAFIAHAI